MRKRPLLFVFVFSLMFVLAAGTALAAGKAKPPAAGPDTITVANFGEPPSLCPVSQNSQLSGLFIFHIFNSLFYFNNDYEVRPDLCESYENVTDTEWIFKLRKGVKFHNGSEMHAEDVVASLQRVKRSPRAARFAAHFTTIEALDEYTVRIVTDVPYSDTLYDLGHHSSSIVPKALIDANHDFNKQPIGTGPFKFKSWVLGDRITLERFDDFFDPQRKARVKTLIFKAIPEPSARTIALEVGEVDIVHQLEFMDVERLKAAPGIKVGSVESSSLIAVTLNNERPGLDNVLVRKALSAAVDRDAIIKVAVNGLGTPCYAQVPMNMPGASDLGVVTFDIEQAKKYMAESGVNPASLDITIVVSEEHRRRIAEVVQADWAEIGVNAKIEMMDVATYLTKGARGEFAASVGGYSNRSLLNWIKTVYGVANFNTSAASPRLNSPAIEAQIAVVEATMDPVKRIAELEKLSKIINELSPRISLYLESLFKAYNANLDIKGIDVIGGHIRYNMVGWLQ